jgi:uncharacterized membrane protein
MSAGTYAWLLASHLIGVFFWIGGLIAVYWLLRIHSHAPREVHEKLTLMERSLALMTDIAATLAIGSGIAMAVHSKLFTAPKSGWFHIKLAVVVLGILSVHGMIRARVGKFGRGRLSPVPQWQWSLLIASVVAILILVTRVRLAFMMP